MQKQSKTKSNSKKFLRNAGAAILSMALVIALVIGLIPGNVVQAAVISDGDTSTKYSESLGDNASTEYAGRIWTDKSVYSEDTTFQLFGGGSATVENDSDFLVAYSALATSQEIKGSTKAPVDVVFIIDISGSMSNQDSGMDNGYSRIYNTVQAVNDAIEDLMALNDYTRVSVVAFSSTAQVLLPLDRYTKSTDRWGNEQDYFSLSINTASRENATLYTRAKNSSNNTISKETSVSGGTNIQMGMYTGMNVLASERQTTVVIDGNTVTRIPSVVLLSDGAPTFSSNSDDWWAPENNDDHGPGSSPYAGNGMKALMVGAYMKAAVDRNYKVTGTNFETTLYTVGMGVSGLENYQENNQGGPGGGPGNNNNSVYTGEQDLAYITLNPGKYWDAENDMAEAIVGAWDEYTDGDRVNPSLYVNREHSYTFAHPDSNDIFTSEDKDALKTLVDAYYDADDAGTVTEVFKNIVSQISIDAAEVPTEIKGTDPMTDGYITYTDPIGKYMEVKDVKSILYAGSEYTVKTKTVSADGLTTTYVFTDEVHSPIYGDQNLNNIVITVTKDASGDETLTVKIPAAVIPVRVNYVELNTDGTVKSHTNNGAYPTRILYTVGLKDGLTTTAADGTKIIDADKIDDAYEAANTNEDGTINFYSNLYTGTNMVNGSTAGDTTVEFEPAHSNPFYYIQEDMPIYVKDAQGNLVQVPSSETIEENGNYYIDDIYYHGTEYIQDTVARTGEQLLKTDLVAVDGYWYRAAGSPRLNRILRFEGTKEVNTTETADDFYAPTFEYAEGSSDPYDGKFVVYLGNNGVINYPGTGALEISKVVEVLDGLTPATDSFRFTVDFNGTNTVVEGSFPYVVTDAAGTVVSTGSVADGGVITLKDGQTAKITRLAPGMTYTVTETKVDGYTTEATGNKGTIVAGTVSEAVFTNTYKVTSVTFPAQGGMEGTKILTGRDWGENDKFTFFITPYNNAPLPDGYDAVNGLTVEYDDATDLSDRWEAEFEFGSINFTQPGVYRYTIVEKEPENEAYLPGMSYSRALYRVVVTVVDNGNGTLSASRDIQQLYTDGAVPLFTYNEDNEIVLNEGQEAQDLIKFVNTYSAEAVTRVPVALKSYTDNSGMNPLVSGMFDFELKAVGYYLDENKDNIVTNDLSKVPMPENAENGAAVTTNEGHNITFLPVKFTQDLIPADSSSITFRYQMREVVPADDQKVNGMTYDDTVYTIDVKVSIDPTSHILKVDAIYPNNERIVTFKNEYTPVPVTADIAGTKTLVGRDMKDGEAFEFSIFGANAATNLAVRDQLVVVPSSTASVSGGKDGVAEAFAFEDIKFNKAGTYVFAVTETPGDAPSVTYDDSTVNVTVVIDDTNKDGNLEVVSITYSNGKNAAEFTNVYTTTFSDTPVSLNGTKNLTGKTLLAGEFYFKVEGHFNGEKVSEKFVSHTEDKTADENGVYTGAIEFLKDQTYSKAGTYEYYITERIPESAVGGTTYDTTVYRYTVVVTDADQDGNKEVGKLTITSKTLEKADGNNWVTVENVVFNNAYKPEELVIPISPMKKVLSGDRATALQAGEFSFELSVVSADPADGVILPATTTVTNDAEGYIRFDAVKFTKAGTYTIKVVEVIPADSEKVPGVTYTTHVITATYEVTDNRTGTLTARIVSSTGGTIIFTNKYESQGTFKLTMNKEFTGRPNDEWLDTDKFQFEVVVLDPATQTAVDNGDIVFPSDDGIIKFEVTKANKSVTSPDITVNKAGTYKFIVREVTGTILGVNYDSNPREVTVTAVDQNNGTIQVSYAVSDPNNYGLTFKNVYDPNSTEISGHDDLVITKVFNGREDQWLDTDAFTFTLAPADDVTNAAVASADVEITSTSLTVTNANKTHAHFGNIVFHKVGTYTFTVTEQPSSIPGVTNDPDAERTVIVHVNDDGNGNLVAHIADNSDSLRFTNQYSVQQTTVAIPAVNKVIDGRDWSANDSFTFVLEATGETVDAVEAGNVVLPENASGVAITGTSENKAAAFGEIIFKAAGTYTFEISETTGSAANMTYDSTVKYVTVEVTDKDANGIPTGQLTATATYSPEGDIVFTNTYVPDPVTADLEGKKVLEGRTLKANEFSFRLTAVTKDAPMPESNLVLNAADGTIDFGEITFTKAGTYKYQITEIQGRQEGMTYDAGVVNVIVNVSYDSATGTFSEPSITYEVGGNAVEEFVFTNSYKGTPVDLIGSKNLKVTKNFTGRTNNRWLATDQFTFTLSVDENHSATVAALNAGNIVMPSETTLVVTNTNKNNAYFGNITFKEAGTYQFVIKEQKSNLAGVTDDADSERVVTVVVTDSNTGKLVISSVDYNNEDLTFNNRYHVSGSLPLEVSKELTGRAWQDSDVFEFELLVDDSATKAAVDAGYVVLPNTTAAITGQMADKTAVLGNIQFFKEGIYKFIVREKTGTIAGIKYDSEPRELVVTVTDVNNNGEYTIQTAITDGKTLMFTNEYEVGHVELSGHANLVVNKQFTGRDNDAWLEGDAFTFTLVPTAEYDDAIAAIARHEADPSTGIKLPDNADGLVVTAANQTHAHFGNIIFHEPGTFVFKVAEKEGDIAGVKYDKTERTITVVVTEDTSTAMLSVAVDAANSEAFTFKNEYQDANVVLTKTQAVSGGNATTDTLAVREGNVVTYYLTVTNNGKGAASDIIITDVVPEGLTLVKESVDPSVIGADGKTLTWKIESMDGAADGNTPSATVSFQVTVPDVTEDTAWKNLAVVKYTNPDNTPEEKPSNEVEIKEGTPDVVVNKVQAVNGGNASKELLSVAAGDKVTYTITATNNGTEAADNIVITDVVPEGLILDTDSVSDGGVISGNTITWKIDSLGTADPYNSVSVSFDVIVPDTKDEFTEWKNIATANVPTDPEDPDEKSDPVTIVDSVESMLVGAKELAGDQVEAAAEYAFNLAAVTEGAPMPASTRATCVGAGSVHFGPIEYSAAGTYVYKITEENAGAMIGGVAYDNSVYYAVVTVGEVVDEETNENGAVVSTAVSYKVQSITYHKDSLDAAGEDKFTFTNSYYDADVVLNKTQSVNDGNPTTETMIVREGDVITYYLTVTNIGKGVASDIVITDVIPEGLTLVEESVAPEIIGSDGKTLTWTIEFMDGAADGNTPSATVSFQAIVPDVTEEDLDETGYKVWKNVASVTYKDPDGTDPDKDPEDPQVEIKEGAPEVSAKKLQAINGGDPTTETIEVVKGDKVTYYITVTNSGTEAAKDIVITDVIPEGLVLVDGSISNHGTEKNGTITWNLGEVAAKDAAGNPGTVTVSFDVTVPGVTQDTTWKNAASYVYGNDPDDPDDPTPPVEIKEGVPEVSVRKLQAVNGGNPTTESLGVREGDEVTYLITVANTGTGIADDVVVTDVIPEGLILKAGSITGGGVLGQDGKTITWTLEDIAGKDAAGNAVEITVGFTVIVPDVTEDTTWKNIAVVDYKNDPKDPDDEEEDPSNPVEVVEGTPNLTFEKTQAINGGAASAGAMDVKAGDVVTYTITVKNTGSEAAERIKITDVIPGGLKLVADSITNGGTEDKGIITWTTEQVAPGETFVVSFQVTVPEVKEKTTWTNIAVVDYENDPEDPDDKEEDPSNPVEVTETPVVPEEKPGLNTGDSANIAGFMGMAVLALGAFFVQLLYRRRAVKK